MRLFVGIPLPQTVQAEVSAVCQRLRSENDGLRWSAQDSWHITLQFLGNATPEQFDCLVAWLATVRSVPVTARLDGLGVFDRAGIFLAKIEPAAALVALQQRVTAATAECGFVAEQRPYQPHITLARTKAAAGKRQLQDLETRMHIHPAFTAFVADEFRLYESHLGPAGSKYEVRQRVRLEPLR